MSEGSFIVKRKRIFAANSHHGGAWKVAYADFVTAMMAFFMLMWLLNTTTEKQRQGLADYFEPSKAVTPVSGGGVDQFSGDSVYALDELAHSGHGGRAPSSSGTADLLDALSVSLKAAIEKEEVRLTLAPEGVIVDLMDTKDDPVFELGKAEATARLRSLLDLIVPSIATSQRKIKIVGHTDDLKFSTPGYTNWELSADRANLARRMAIAKGVSEKAFFEISGQADRMPIDDNKSAPKNRRISIILLDDPRALEAAAVVEEPAPGTESEGPVVTEKAAVPVEEGEANGR